MWSERPACLDTNVAIYAFTGHGAKAAAARAVLRAADFISVQLLNEFANIMVRKQGRPWSEVKLALERICRAVPRVLPLDIEAHSAGMKIFEQYRLSIYDSLMLGVALTGGARTFYSEDMQHGMAIFENLRVVNPFLPGALDT